MGSGTTAVVSQKLNRKWLGSELSPNYCELIQKRIDEVQGGLF
jgi:DNA modification methylase